MTRWSTEEMYRLARNGVTKIDLHGKRGATLVSSEEIIAMAAVIALHVTHPLPGEPSPGSQSLHGEQS